MPRESDLEVVTIVLSPLQKQYRKLVRFERKHNLKHNPIRTLQFLAQRVVKLSHCPCRPSRLRCPCGQALKEIKKKGHCLCWEFFSPDFDYRNNGRGKLVKESLVAITRANNIG